MEYVLNLILGTIDKTSSVLAAATCTSNGQVVDCGQVANAAMGGIAFIFMIWLAIMFISLLGMIFWIIMLVHAATKPIENKALWIVVLALTGMIGAVVYYFAVKREFDKQARTSPPVPVTTA